MSIKLFFLFKAIKTCSLGAGGLLIGKNPGKTKHESHMNVEINSFIIKVYETEYCLKLFLFKIFSLANFL